MQQGIKKLQWFEYLVVFLEILNTLLCQVFANQVTYNSIEIEAMMLNVMYRKQRKFGVTKVWRIWQINIHQNIKFLYISNGFQRNSPNFTNPNRFFS